MVMDEVERAIGYNFRHPSLLEEALTHRSCIQGKWGTPAKDNERLEFVGDSVLALVVSECLATTFPNFREGELSKIKARLVSRETLAQVARQFELGRWLKLGPGEERTKGREKSSLLGNALEAVIGAMYLDGGMPPVRKFILQIFDDELQRLTHGGASADLGDAKSRLQEWSHRRFGSVPEYRMVGESGPDHRKTFEAEVFVNGEVLGRGQGFTKKEAEQRAASQALQVAPTDANNRCMMDVQQKERSS